MKKLVIVSEGINTGLRLLAQISCLMREIVPWDLRVLLVCLEC